MYVIKVVSRTLHTSEYVFKTSVIMPSLQDYKPNK